MDNYTKEHKYRIFEFIRGRSKCIGYVQNGVFYKKLKASKHFLKVPPGIAFNLTSLHDARRVGATQVSIIDTETGDRYTSTVEKVVKDGFELDRGYGKQVCLPLKYWQVDEAHKTYEAHTIRFVEQLSFLDIGAREFINADN